MADKEIIHTELEEKVEVGGGETGTSMVPGPVETGSSARPADKAQGEPMQKLSKTQMLSAAVGAMSKMGKSDLHNVYSSIVSKAPARKADKGGAPEPMPKLSMAEDVQEMFSGQDLSEEFIENAVTIFEAAVHARLTVEQAKLEEEFEASLSEAVESAKEELAQKVDDYLTYAVEEWVKDNQLAVETSIKTEVTESFIQGLKGLFETHYIDIPEDKLDILGQLSSKVEELESKLDEQITTNIELSKELDEAVKREAFDAVCEGLAMTQVEKFKTLSEGIEFDSVDSYTRKLEVIRENYFNKTEKKQALLEEEVIVAGDDEQTTTVKHDPAMEKYVSAISKTVKK